MPSSNTCPAADEDGNADDEQVLHRRAEAARKLIRAGKLDPLEALALVVWPPRNYRDAERRESERRVSAASTPPPPDRSPSRA